MTDDGRRGVDRRRPPVLAVVGPTGSGKSAAAMAAARRDARVEIVAVDAFTVYRGMDVGTAKPTAADRVAVAHHCVDVLDPGDEVDVAWFRDQARVAIAAVHARGGIPLLVGGAGLYFRAVVDDMHFAPTDRHVRARLEARWAGRATDAHAALAALDREAADRIEPGNIRRSVRALEVIELTGRPFSSFSGTPYASVVGDLDVVMLDPDRDQLRRRIDGRARSMVEHGLLDEARSLRAAPGGVSATARQAIGYAESFAVLDGEQDESWLIEAIGRRTWSYARRQRSWFRRDPRCQEPVTTSDEAAAALRGLLAAT